MSQATRQAPWIEWTRTALQPREREELLAALTAEPGVGVVFRPEDGGPEQRARFTHGRHFRTPRGELYVDAEGRVRAA
jgi:hypothetical protein